MKYFWFIFLSFPTVGLAFFCPTNFTQINIGLSQAQVIAACGQPDKQETKDAVVTLPQEWNYFKQQQSPNYMGANFSNQIQGNLKTAVVFDANDKVVNINVNGIGLSATTICGAPIQLGDDKVKVKAACGAPSYVNQSTPQGPAQPPNKITTLFYNQSTPPAKLIFENGILTSKE